MDESAYYEYRWRRAKIILHDCAEQFTNDGSTRYAGADFPDADNKTRAARKKNQRVDVKIYTLDLGSDTASVSANPSVQR